MDATITQKILAFHSNRKSVEPGEFIEAKIDFCLGNDITAPLAIKEFEKAGAGKVFDNERVALIPDHFTPNKDLKSANQAKILRDFAERRRIRHYYEVGRMGIEHALLPELGLVLPGELIIGADSHTCTYGALGAFSTGVGSTDLAYAMITGRSWFKVPRTGKFIYEGRLNKWVGGKDIMLFTIGKIGVSGALYEAMELGGPVISRLPIDDRFAMCNMAIEAGARTGMIEPDEITLKFVRGRAKRNFKIYRSDKDAGYTGRCGQWDLSKLEPQVACPSLPENVKPVSRVRNVNVDQVVIGSCTNGRISDLRIAGKILKNKKAKSNVRLIIIPATQKIYMQAVREGLAEIFLKAGGVFSTPTCGPCLGGHMGILAEGEVAVATTNRNFVGRMGDTKSKVYLSNPAVAAASAIKGKITHPEDAL
ncbi:3-isopropylmalate dehydratase large subunit [Omnitrophica bacterium]|nr:3-isopropylmalate dehydratase large subunit [Candidatus Omnitrophota bacterium]